MKKTVQCESCWASSFEKLFNVSDYRLNTSIEVFSLQRCQSCGHIVLTPKPDVSQLDKYYPNSFYSSGKPNILTRINYKVALNKLSKLVKSGRLLDIGCGSGEFLGVAIEHGYDGYGQEISLEGVRIAKQKFGSRIYDKDLTECNFQSDYFDVITLWHVAEHVLDINAYLNEIYRILSPKGILIVEVPNFDCIERKLFESYSLIIDAPRHLRHFTKKTLRKILENSGFQCEINNGWSFIISPLSILNSARHFLYAKLTRRKAAYVYRMLFLPLLLISAFNSLFSVFFQTKAVIGAKCTKTQR